MKSPTLSDSDHETDYLMNHKHEGGEDEGEYGEKIQKLP